MERDVLERILEQLKSMESRLEALERRGPEPGARETAGGHRDGDRHRGRDRDADERGSGQQFEEKRVVDLIVDLVEERLVRVLERHHREHRGGESHEGRRCRHCGQSPHFRDRP